MNAERKIKVIIGINDFLIGGAQKFLADLLSNMDRERFEPVVITLFYWEEKEYFYDLIPSGIPVHRLRFSGFVDVTAWIQLYRLLSAVDADIVLSNLFFSNAVFRILKPLFRYRVITVEHNTYIDKSRIHRILDRLLSFLTARIVAVSRSVADFTASQEGIAREKFIVIHNGIEVGTIRARIDGLPSKETLKQELGFQEQDKILLNVARLTPQKNHKLLIDGFALFHGRYPLYKLAIVGGGGLQDELEEFARKKGVGSAVVFFGSRRDVWKFYKASDMFVSASDIEGLSITFLEAQASGLPLVATKTAGTDEIIEDGRNGFYIEGSSPDAVAGALEKAVGASLSDMSTYALESIQRFDITTSVKNYTSLFEQTLGIE